MDAIKNIRDDIEKNGVCRADIYSLENLTNDNFITSSIVLEDFSRSKTTLFRHRILNLIDDKIKFLEKEQKRNVANFLWDTTYKVKLENLREDIKDIKRDSEKIDHYTNLQYMYANENNEYVVLDDNTSFIHLLHLNDAVHGKYVDQAKEFFFDNNNVLHPRSDGIVYLIKIITDNFFLDTLLNINDTKIVDFLKDKTKELSKELAINYSNYNLTVADLRYIKDNSETIIKAIDYILKAVDIIEKEINDVTKIYKRQENKELIKNMRDFISLITQKYNDSNLRFFVVKPF